MSGGGKSLKRKDYLTMGAILAATGGLGAAGIGPLAGLLGSGAAGAAGGAGAAGMTAAELAAAGAGTSAGTAAAGTAAGMGELASVGEVGGTMLGGAAPQVVTPSMTAGGLLGKGADAMSQYNKAMQLAKLAQGPEQGAPQAAPRPQQQQVSTDPLAGIEAIFGIKRKKENYYG